jgi:L,D-peptidoglycan transpeptidase YkuD (ErfK/YbiS/YcfS/YnhG family)
VRKTVTYLHVRAINACAVRGVLTCGPLSVPCALGRSGRNYLKREGDGGSPVGIWLLRRIYYRNDNIVRPLSKLPASPIKGGWGWCETVGDRNYNRRVNLPYAAAHEDLKRSDHLYDIVVESSHNQRPRIQGRGSAIFFHIARQNFTPTAGCIAVTLKDMRKVLPYCSTRTRLVIWPPSGAAPHVFRK